MWGRLAELRGPQLAPRPLDARALAALAANPGCRRRALLDGAGVDKAALATALGSPSSFGQSQFALVRGNAFEARVKADGGSALLRLVHARIAPGAPAPEPANSRVPDLSAAGPEGRTARTALALREAAAAAAAEGAWTLLDHPLLALDVAGSPAFLEPDAVVVRPDGRWTVVEIKSFPMIDGSSDPAKVGAAARQAAVYVLALQEVARRVPSAGAGADAGVGAGGPVDEQVLLVCPKDFSNLPAAAAVDIRRQLAVTRRQLARLTRVEEIAGALPPDTCFDPGRPAADLHAAVSAVPAAYAPECLAACELAFHCRAHSRAGGEVTVLGRSVRAELGSLSTVDEVLAVAHGTDDDTVGTSAGTSDPTAAALRRAHALRAQALAGAIAAASTTAATASASAAAPAPAPTTVEGGRA